ncbi:SCP2 sterol-binding domain-containing protein [Micromonospora sp. RTP1Z1]|uniref:SCP2 sterol-binding domain-containing protein n=1 Tax=Micromonospora sp. RTP1Z1 TaxID=2994043 RepID=UPI0029C8946F|nr:SCP2 sterol-binding domain-containing protein [Micromonospora sp. RTP1Z1]
MGEATEQFFASLPARARMVLRGSISGILQVDLATGNRTDHWLVELKPGSARVTQGRGPADAVWSSSADLFERLVTGRAQAIAATFRNEATFSGNVVLFLAFRAFFPDPPGTRDPRMIAREQVGRSA